MKIAVLTMVFNNNYGGYLQCFALLQTLKKMGHEPHLLHIKMRDRTLFSFLRIGVKYLVGLLDRRYNIAYQGKLIKKFETVMINPKTRAIYSAKDFKKYGSGFDAYIVGSDQVWRPDMYRFIDEAFLSFVENRDSLRISYAASFGVNYWMFDENQTEKLKKLLSRFNAVSVREDSAVNLCQIHLQRVAEHVLDPTMLLEKSEYEELIEGSSLKGQETMVTYILDESDKNKNIIEKVSEELGLGIIKANRDLDSSKQDRYIHPSVANWLSKLMNAEIVLTDSFHGAVFAIIFNKEFFVMPNDRRGNTRIDSLLRLFKLEERLLRNPESFNPTIIRRKIEWRRVNKILDEQKLRSKKFLFDALNKGS